MKQLTGFGEPKMAFYDNDADSADEVIYDFERFFAIDDENIIDYYDVVDDDVVDEELCTN